MSSVSVILPAYNEEKGIAVVLERLHKLSLEKEIIVVDDGSTDATAEVAQRGGARVIRHPTNGGYGLSLKSGIRAAKHDLIAIADADGTYPVEQLSALVAKVEEGFDMAVGARHGKEYRGTFLKMPARLLFKILVEFSTGRHIPDINSGLRAFRKRDALPLLPLLCDAFSFTTTLTLAYCFLHRFIAYVPITYEKRIGTAKVRIVRDSLRTLQYILESIAYFNPFKLFLLLSFFIFFLSAASAVIAWWLWLSFPLLLAALFLLGSFLLFALGILADTLRLTAALRDNERTLSP